MKVGEVISEAQIRQIKDRIVLRKEDMQTWKPEEED